MIEFLSTLTPWHWLILGIILIAAEITVPGTFLLWPGLAAILVGLLNALIPTLPWTASIAIWAILSLLTVAGFFLYRKKHPAKTIPNTLNQRGTQYIGQHYTLEKPIVNNKGELRVDDTIWKIVADHDIPAGATVTVLAVEGTSLRVAVT